MALNKDCLRWTVDENLPSSHCHSPSSQIGKSSTLMTAPCPWKDDIHRRMRYVMDFRTLCLRTQALPWTMRVKQKTGRVFILFGLGVDPKAQSLSRPFFTTQNVSHTPPAPEVLKEMQQICACTHYPDEWKVKWRLACWRGAKRDKYLSLLACCSRSISLVHPGACCIKGYV